MEETRHQFRQDLKELERQALGGLDLVISQLDRALESVSYQDVELAAMVVADDDRIDGRYLEVHQGILSLLARQAPVAGDLRIVAALLHVIRCIERMGDQCVNIAKLVPLSGHESPKDKDILDGIERMGQLARSQVSQAKEALGSRNVELAQDLVRQDAEINRINREIFRRAVEVGDDLDMREWGMFMILVARCLERIGDNTVDIAEQVVFVVTGLFQRDGRRLVGRQPEPRPAVGRSLVAAGPAVGRVLGSRRARGRTGPWPPPGPWARRGPGDAPCGGRAPPHDVCPRGQCPALVTNLTLSGMNARPPQIVAFGGGGFSMEWGNPLLDDHVLSLTEVPCPKVCFLPTASGDADHYVVRFYRAFPSSRCQPSHISLFRRETGVGDPRAHLLEQDLIYVGGGSLVSLMGTWRSHGLDEALAEAWRAGAVLCGGSAGSLCWFADAVSGFHEGPPRRLAGLGFLPFSNAVHYNEEPGRRSAFLDAVAGGMSAGYGIGDGAALHFVGTELAEAVSSVRGAQARFVCSDATGGVVEQELAVRYLGDPVTVGGDPVTVAGDPVTVGGDPPTVAAGVAAPSLTGRTALAA